MKTLAIFNGMNKEKDLPAGRQDQKTDAGFSEKELDLAVDKTKNFNQVKAGNIFDPSQNKKKKNKES